MDNHLNNTYQERMNQTLQYKLDAVLPHLKPGIKILDFGSGFSPEFIYQIEKRGVTYHAYDVSKTVQRQLSSHGTVCLKSLTEKVDYYDVIFASSVFHELISYQTESERNAIIHDLMNTLKQFGKIIVRDWDFAVQLDNVKKVKSVPFRMEKLVEIRQWCDALFKNKIIKWFYIDTRNYTVIASEFDVLQIMFHVTWGLNSMERESKEIYPSIMLAYKMIRDYIEPDDVKIDGDYIEKDITYLPHLQKYFRIDTIPCHTKRVLTLTKFPKIEI